MSPFHEQITAYEGRHGVWTLAVRTADPSSKFGRATIMELMDRVRQIGRDPSASAIILKSLGPEFCAGTREKLAPDLARFNTAEKVMEWARHVAKGSFTFWDLDIPVIAQVHGLCLNEGCDLAAACDLVYVTFDTQIGHDLSDDLEILEYAQMGMRGLLPWLVGIRCALEMALTGRRLIGETAVSAGFANNIFPRSSIDEAVIEIGCGIAALPADARRMLKRITHNQIRAMGVREAIMPSEGVVPTLYGNLHLPFTDN